MNRNSNGMSTGMALLCTLGILLFIHPAVVLQRRIKALWIHMMMDTMRFMRMMITTGIATGTMMTMRPVWMTPWKMRIGKSGRETHEQKYMETMQKEEQISG